MLGELVAHRSANFLFALALMPVGNGKAIKSFTVPIARPVAMLTVVVSALDQPSRRGLRNMARSSRNGAPQTVAM